MIYIVADQWRGDCLGLYGNSHPVMTPHLNQLAAEGVAFTLKKIYQAAGAENQLKLVIGDGGHRFYADAAWKQARKLFLG